MNSAAYARIAGRRLNDGRSTWGWIRVAFWICIVIAIAVVIRRTLALAYPPQSSPPQLAGLDADFASHAMLTLAHIIPALLFVVLLPFVYTRRFAREAWVEKLLFPFGVIVAVTAFAMNRFAVGGWIERSAVLVFNSLFLYSLIRAWSYRSSNTELKLRWFTRAIGVLLGIATTRPVMGVFFATSRITHLSPHQFFGIAFWIGFSINAVAIELWLRSRKGQLQIAELASSR